MSDALTFSLSINPATCSRSAPFVMASCAPMSWRRIALSRAFSATIRAWWATFAALATVATNSAR